MTGEDVRLFLDRMVGEGTIPGVVFLGGRPGQRAEAVVAGRAQVHGGPARPMREDTLFDLASLTKVVATLPAVLVLAERGELGLGDRAVKFLPGLRGERRDEITIGQLLAHTSGLPAEIKFWREYSDPAEARLAMLQVPLEHSPRAARGLLRHRVHAAGARGDGGHRCATRRSRRWARHRAAALPRHRLPPWPRSGRGSGGVHRAAARRQRADRRRPRRERQVLRRRGRARRAVRPGQRPGQVPGAGLARRRTALPRHQGGGGPAADRGAPTAGVAWAGCCAATPRTRWAAAGRRPVPLTPGSPAPAWPSTRPAGTTRCCSPTTCTSAGTGHDPPNIREAVHDRCGSARTLTGPAGGPVYLVAMRRLPIAA